MSDRKLSQLPQTGFVMPSWDMATSGQRLYENQHTATTNRANADALAAYFPANPTLIRRRNDYAQILTGQGVPIEQAMAEAEAAIPDAAPPQPEPGSQLPPITAPADLGALGRNGDTMVAHINPAEAEMLKKSGGSGTINPRTGLPEFYSDSANEHSRATTGRNMADRNRPDGRGGNTAGGTGGGAQATGKGNATIADKMIMDKYLADPNEKVPDERSYWDAVGNLGHRYTDYKDYGNTGLENLGNFALGWGTGISEIDPTKQALGASRGKRTASWGFDPVGAGLGLAGMAVGAPLGLVYGIGKKALGVQGPMVSFDGYNGSPGMNSGNTSPSSVTGNPGPGPSSPGRGDAGGTHLLPQVAGAPNQGAAPQDQAGNGSLLPPISAPSSGTYPGAYVPVAGPSNYGWNRPSWAYRL